MGDRAGYEVRTERDVLHWLVRKEVQCTLNERQVRELR